LTFKPIEVKFGMTDYARHATPPDDKIGGHPKSGVAWGMGEVVLFVLF